MASQSLGCMWSTWAPLFIGVLSFSRQLLIVLKKKQARREERRFSTITGRQKLRRPYSDFSTILDWSWSLRAISSSASRSSFGPASGDPHRQTFGKLQSLKAYFIISEGTSFGVQPRVILISEPPASFKATTSVRHCQPSRRDGLWLELAR